MTRSFTAADELLPIRNLLGKVVGWARFEQGAFVLDMDAGEEWPFGLGTESLLG